MSESGHETEIDLIVDLGWNTSVSGGQCEGLVLPRMEERSRAFSQ